MYYEWIIQHINCSSLLRSLYIDTGCDLRCMMGNVGSRLAEVLFISGDVQTSSIAIFILGMLSFTIICAIFGLLYHKPPAPQTKKKRKKSNGMHLARAGWSGGAAAASSGQRHRRNMQRVCSFLFLKPVVFDMMFNFFKAFAPRNHLNNEIKNTLET